MSAKFQAFLAISVQSLLLLLLATSQIAAAPFNAFNHIYDVTILERENVTDTTLRLSLAVGNTSYTLLLSENPAFADLEVFDNKRSRTAATKAYSGTIENLPASWARITINGDLISGVIDSGSERLYVSSNARSTMDREIRRFQTALDHSVRPPPLIRRGRQTREVVQIPVDSGPGRHDGSSIRLVARIAIVVDSFYNEALGGRGLAQAISTINTVDGIYQNEFGLALKVDTAIIITDTETMDLAHVSLQDNLARFRDYRLSAVELPPGLAMVHLFTGVQTTDPSVGLAYIGAACREDGYDVSMSTPFEYPVLLTAHEIAHNLGAVHDDETELCQLSDTLLMHSQIRQTTQNEFSVCTIDAIEAHLQENTCYLAAIDLSLTLSREGDDSLIALVTNTDTQQAVPAAKLSIKLKNANIASAPASCQIDSTTDLNCVIPTIKPGDSHSVAFAIRYDDALENTVDASLEAIDFIDIATINNYAQVVFPASEQGTDTHTIAGNDAPDTTGANTGNSTGESGGGHFSFSAILWLLCLLTLSTVRRRYLKTRNFAAMKFAL